MGPLKMPVVSITLKVIRPAGLDSSFEICCHRSQPVVEVQEKSEMKERVASYVANRYLTSPPDRNTLDSVNQCPGSS
ncbi:hypothetical protein BDR03DRAFT_942843 [Suillus americanus]|nr:hypothetical protein BDR03DRAFT_942843 [Suillus americanus]